MLKYDIGGHDFCYVGDRDWLLVWVCDWLVVVEYVCFLFLIWLFVC